MRFLLVAPIRRQSEELVSQSRRGDDDRVAKKRPMQSRLQSQDKLLRQHWTDLDVTQPEDEAREVHVDLAAYCQIRGCTYFALEATLDSNRVDELQVPQLEGLLSRSAIAFIGDKSEFGAEDVNWVARYALLSHNEFPPSGWLATMEQRVDVSAECGVDTDQVELSLGWGNGAIYGWSALNGEQQKLTVRGIIDAQLIWHEASLISENNLEILERIEELQVRPPRKSVRELANSCSSNSLMTTGHQLLFDEVLLHIQGIRRLACLELLRAWGYQHFSTRIVERISNAETQVSALQDRLNSRYQSAVEKILILLSMLTIVDLALSLISTSFSGATSAKLHADAIGVFRWVRSSDADLIFAGAVLITLLVSLVFVRRK